MNRRARSCLVLWLSACAVTPGCLFSNKPKAAQTPPLPAPTPSSTPAMQAPATQPTPTAVTPAPTVSRTRTVQQRKPPTPASIPTQPATAPPPVPAPAPPVTPAPVTPEASPAQLREILTPQQRAELTRNLDQSLAAAHESLSKVAGRQMSRDQAETARLVSSFAAQAESARPTDLIVAAQLARRAELLARELVNSMH